MSAGVRPPRLLWGRMWLDPRLEEIEIGLRLPWDPLQQSPDLFERSKEPLDAPILPWCEGRGALLADPESPEAES